MPSPVAETPQWLTNLGILLGFIGTSIGGWWVSRRERRKPEAETLGTVSIVGGVLQDKRAIEGLTDQIARNGKHMLDLIDVQQAACRMTERNTIAVNDLRDAIERQSKSDALEEARMMAIIERSRRGG